MKYPSKRDLWIGLVLWVSIILGLWASFVSKSIAAIIVIFLLTIFVGWIWFFTYYIIGENDLVVRCGPIRLRIALASILSVKRTRNPLSSMALSLQRLEVRYGQHGYVLISPKEMEEFLKELKKKSPNSKMPD